jgi:hemolysin III
MTARYSKGEEIANTSTHAVGILMGVVIGVIFIVMSVKGGDAWAEWSIGLYLFGMLGSYIASTLYHALPQDSHAKQVLRKFDHAAIYWHIAGSYSPITLLAIMQKYPTWGICLFCFIWIAAIVGTVFSFVKLKPHSHFETICYVLMGMVVLVAFKPLVNAVSPHAVGWIVGEGVCYITGALFYSFNKRKYMHSVFHFFVLAGSVCHILAVWDILKDFI